MDIKNVTQAQARNANEGRAVAENAGARSPGAKSDRQAGAGGDQVTLTDTARRLSDLTQTVNAQPVVDTDRVAEIRAAIQEGRYEVDAGRVAERLLQTERLF